MSLHNITTNALREFDEKFGKTKEGVGYGDDASEGRLAGCDDCDTNQQERAEHRQFLTSQITKAYTAGADDVIRKCAGELEEMIADCPNHDENKRVECYGYIEQNNATIEAAITILKGNLSDSKNGV